MSGGVYAQSQGNKFSFAIGAKGGALNIPIKNQADQELLNAINAQERVIEDIKNNNPPPKLKP